MSSSREMWKTRAILSGLIAVIVLASLLPLGTGFYRMPGPDLILCLICAVVLRRPEYMPIGLVVGLIFVADALLMRPLGLWTLLILIGSEYLRRVLFHSQALTPLEEGIQVAGTMLACFAGEALILTLLLAERPPLGGQLIHIILTLLAYPLVVLFTQSVLRIRRLQPGEVDAMGTHA